MTCCYCGFSTKSKGTFVKTEDGRTRCKSHDACRRRLRSGTHLTHRVLLSLMESPNVLEPPLVSAERKRADQHERYRKGLCMDCGLVRYSAGRPRCNKCHVKHVTRVAYG